MKYYKNLSIDESSCTVKKEGQPIHLTAMEYQLFVTLLAIVSFGERRCEVVTVFSY